MDCAICRRLQAELDWLEQVHAEKLRVVEAIHWQLEHRGEFDVLRSAESNARLELEIARAELNRHRRDKHGMG